MRMKTKVIGSFFLAMVLLATRARSQCSLRTDLDFGTNSPLLISNGKFDYPNRRIPVVLNFVANQSQEVYCPGAIVETLGASSGSNSLSLSCSSGSQFHAPVNVREFSNIRCNRDPASSTRNLNYCPSGNVAEIGFQITRGIFVSMIDLCFNSGRGRTTWAHAVITEAITGRQTIGNPPNFRLDGYYKDIQVVQAYTRERQRQQLLAVLGDNQTLVDRYIPATGDHFLARGHLIARADMYYTAQQYATYYYINVLPMWQSINAGNWLLVEDSVRALARNYGDVEVWAGSLYDLELFYTPSEDRIIYLGNHRIQSRPVLIVPRLLFKVAYQRAFNRAIVYITVNNPYLGATNPLPIGYQACTEYQACRQNEPRFNNVDRGFTYCCLWSDFIADGYASGLGLPNLGNPTPFQ